MISQKEITADQEKVTAMTKYVMQNGVDAYLMEHKDISLIDCLMVSHNIHKLMVTRIAEQWVKLGIPAEKTYRMADLTFRKAIRQLWRSG